MGKEKRAAHKVVMTEGKRDIIRSLLSEYEIKSAQDLQDALKDLLGGTIKEMMEVEIEHHLRCKNRNVVTLMITVTDIKPKRYNQIWEKLNYTFRRTGNPRLNLRWCAKDKKTFRISTIN